MAMFVITNRQRDGSGFGGEPESHGGLHLLMSDLDAPQGASDFNEVEDAAEYINLFLEEMRVLVNGQTRPKAVLFIHGYNTDFEEAVAGIVELEVNLRERGFVGKVVGFTWPSEGNTIEYLEDRDDAVGTTPAFKNLMRRIQSISLGDGCFFDAICVAHSMGNYVLRMGLNAYSKIDGYPARRGVFDQTLLLAPDINAYSLGRGGNGSNIPVYSKRTHIYYSPHDSALGFSSTKRLGAPRLGRSGPVDFGELPPNVVALDCRNHANEENAEQYKTTVHSSYKSVPRILDDMVAVMRGIDREMIPGRVPKEAGAKNNFLLEA